MSSRLPDRSRSLPAPGGPWRHWLLLAVALAGVLAAALIAPLAQDLGYHGFADRRTIAGVPNFWNVITNLPFLLVGLHGLQRGADLPPAARRAWAVFAGAAILIGAGSIHYHLDPGSATLLWDRLPITVAIMALFSAVLMDRVSLAVGRTAFAPLLVAGLASVAWWYWGESRGAGDLRAYALVQFLPMVLVPLILLIYPPGRLRGRWLWATLATYALAKGAELADPQVLAATGFISGHSVKHLLAALAIWWAMLAVPPGRRAFLDFSPRAGQPPGTGG